MDEELTTFLIKNIHTGTLLTEWILIEIEKNKNVKEKLMKELKNSNDNFDEKDYPYLKLIIKETLRLYPTVNGYTRKAINDDVISGYKIPKGTTLVISPYLTHRNSTYWNSPDSFIPERFEKDIEDFTYIPYGIGNRSCPLKDFSQIQNLYFISDFLKNYEYKIENLDKIKSKQESLFISPNFDVLFSLKKIKK
jgi:cytochrome P450